MGLPVDISELIPCWSDLISWWMGSIFHWPVLCLGIVDTIFGWDNAVELIGSECALAWVRSFELGVVGCVVLNDLGNIWPCMLEQEYTQQLLLLPQSMCRVEWMKTSIIEKGELLRQSWVFSSGCSIWLLASLKGIWLVRLEENLVLLGTTLYTLDHCYRFSSQIVETNSVAMLP